MVEVGVFYSFRPGEGTHPYSYTRIHTPSQQKERLTVYLVYPGNDLLLRLLDWWNRGDTNWKYHSGHQVRK